MDTPTASLKPIPRIRERPLVGSLGEYGKDRLGLLLRIARECPDLGALHLGPMRLLLVTSARLYNSLLTTHAEAFHHGKLVHSLEPLMGPHSLILTHGEPHRQQRKLMAPVFQPRRVAELAPVMVRDTVEAVAGWGEGASLDLREEMMLLTMRIVGHTLFGVDFLHEARDLGEAIQVALDHATHVSSNPVTFPLSWPTPRNVRTRRALATIHQRLQALIDERRREGASGGNLLSMMLAHRDESGQGLSDAQLRDHSVTLFAAGHETTALLLSWTWLLLMRHPEHYAAVQREVDEILGDREPTLEDLPRLGFTLQVIKEALRLYPPGYLQGRAPLHDVVVDGFALRKDEMILLSNYVLHRDAEVFPEPERFLPERFLPEAEKQRPRTAYMPFGIGPHTCIGNHFTLMEAHLLVAVMAQRVRFELLPGQEVRPVAGLTLGPSPYRVRVQRRQAAARLAE